MCLGFAEIGAEWGDDRPGGGVVARGICAGRGGRGNPRVRGVVRVAGGGMSAHMMMRHSSRSRIMVDLHPPEVTTAPPPGEVRANGRRPRVVRG